MKLIGDIAARESIWSGENWYINVKMIIKVIMSRHSSMKRQKLN